MGLPSHPEVDRIDDHIAKQMQRQQIPGPAASESSLAIGAYSALHKAVRLHNIERLRQMQDKIQTYACELQPRLAADLIAERKAQIAQEQAARQAEKDRNHARQRSVGTAPEVRIALWEARHALALPRDPKHRLMQVIADDTELDVAQVQDERGRRALLRVAAAG